MVKTVRDVRGMSGMREMDGALATQATLVSRGIPLIINNHDGIGLGLMRKGRQRH